MTEANLGIYSMLRPRKSAFDYFVQGQEAKQNYESNQQMMAARQQAMEQAEQMNPLLIEAQRAGIAGTEATTAFNQFQTDRGEQMLPHQIAQAKAATGASRASTRASNMAMDNTTEDRNKKKITQQQIMLGNLAEQAMSIEDPVDQWEFIRDVGSKFGVSEDQLKNINLDEMVKTKDALIKSNVNQNITPYQKANLDMQERRLTLEQERLEQAGIKLNPDDVQNLSAAQKRGAEIGGIEGKKIATAGNALAASGAFLELLNNIKNHEGKKRAVGTSRLSVIPGVASKANDFNLLLEQAKGKMFLEAFESLKGAGQITEVEGNKATVAIGQLSTAQTEDQFDKALNTLIGVVDSNKGRLQSFLQKNGVSSGGDVKADDVGNIDSAKFNDAMKKWGVE